MSSNVGAPRVEPIQATIELKKEVKPIRKYELLTGKLLQNAIAGNRLSVAATITVVIPIFTLIVDAFRYIHFTFIMKKTNKEIFHATLEGQVSKIVQAYKEINKKGLSGSHVPVAKQKIVDAEEKILKTMLDNLKGANTLKSLKKRYGAHLNTVDEMIKKSAGDDQFAVSSRWKGPKDPDPLLANVIISNYRDDLSKSLESELEKLAIEIVGKAQDNLKALEYAVARNLISSKQAEKLVTEFASSSFFDTYSKESLKKAIEQENKIYDVADSMGLLLEDDRNVIKGPKELAKYAVTDLFAQVINRGDEDLEVLVSETADLLVREKRLTQEDRSEFSSETLTILHKKLEEEKRNEALRVKEVAETEDQTRRVGKFTDFLNVISEKQKELSRLFASRVVSGRQIELSKNNILRLSSEKGDAKDVEVIRAYSIQINSENKLVQELSNSFNATTEQIEKNYQEILLLNEHYNRYASNRKQLIHTKNQPIINEKEIAVHQKQRTLDEQYKKVIGKKFGKLSSALSGEDLDKFVEATIKEYATKERAEVAKKDEANAAKQEASKGPDELPPQMNLEMRGGALVPKVPKANRVDNGIGLGLDSQE